MALVKCSECKKDISDKAVACPGCGSPLVTDTGVKIDKKKKESSSFERIAKGTLFGVAAVLACMAIFRPTPTPVSPSTNAEASAVPANSRSSCAVGNLSCLGNEGVIAAGVYCRSSIERLAKHSVRWTDRTLESKFSRFRWKNKGRGEITYVGDKVEFQNGFGAFTPVIYECDLASDGKTVLDVRLLGEGRLPD